MVKLRARDSAHQRAKLRIATAVTDTQGQRPFEPSCRVFASSTSGTLDGARALTYTRVHKYRVGLGPRDGQHDWLTGFVSTGEHCAAL